MRTRLKLTALAAMLCAAACAGPSGTSALRAPQFAPQSARPAVVRANDLTFTVFTAGQTAGFNATAFAVDLAAGPGGNMWFTDDGTPAIGRIAPDGTVTEFTSGLPSGAHPYSIVAGPDGNMWFSDNRGVALGVVTPDGQITEYDAPQFQNSHAMGIAFGARGEPWIVGFGSQPMLAHYTHAGKIDARLLSDRMTPTGALTADARGDLWLFAANSVLHGLLLERRAHGSGLARTRVDVHKQLVPCCPNEAAKTIAAGADGHPWFTLLEYGHRHSPATFIGTFDGNRVRLMRITHRGLSNVAFPSGIAASGKGFWVTGGDPFQNNGAIWRIGIDGRQVAHDVPYDPYGLTVDAGGHPWFTATFSGSPSKIVEVMQQ